MHDAHPDAVLAAMASAVGSDAVVGAEAVVEEYWGDEALGATRVRPRCVVRPSSTAEVAAVVVAARELHLAVTARGAGTGLSGACIPVEGGIVVSFERMASLVELDVAAQCAVVQPGLTLAELDVATAEVGLVYPVFPGTNAASLGGNVATNAGGMRAVKYGVTRHQVLGVEAVTGTGEVIRCGGRFVKSSSGYDLTQLIVGSEGTLALVTEATLRLHPRLGHTATMLVPFESVDALAEVIPLITASGVGAMILEYIDRFTMAGLLRANDLTLGVPDEVAASTGAYLVIVLEDRTPTRLDDDVAETAELLTKAGATDVFVLPPGQGQALLSARERAFWMVKAAGADDLLDMVVPRDKIPEYLRQVQAIASEYGSGVFGCGHAGDGNIHFSVFERDPARRSRLVHDILAMGASLGGAVSGEHGIGRMKKEHYLALADPALVELERRIKQAFDPDGILNPGCTFDPA